MISNLDICSHTKETTKYILHEYIFAFDDQMCGVIQEFRFYSLTFEAVGKLDITLTDMARGVADLKLFFFYIILYIYICTHMHKVFPLGLQFTYLYTVCIARWVMLPRLYK